MIFGLEVGRKFKIFEYNGVMAKENYFLGNSKMMKPYTNIYRKDYRRGCKNQDSLRPMKLDFIPIRV